MIKSLQFVSPKTLFIIGALLLGFIVAVEQADASFNLTLAETRPIALGLGIVLTLIAIWRFIMLVRTGWQHRDKMTISASLQVLGWLPFAISIGFLVLFLAIDGAGENAPWSDKQRLIESLIPLILGIQTAMLFSPEDEPALEISLSYPRPIAWTLLERLVIAAFLQAIIALGGMVIIGGQDWVDGLLRWFPALVFLGGLGTYVTLKSRVAAFGVAIVGIVWFLFIMFGVSLLPSQPTFTPLNYIQPFIWIFNPYLQPTALPSEVYWINRLVVCMAGIYLIGLAVDQLRNPEELLFGTARKAR